MLTILHASDLHFGKHFDSSAARKFREIPSRLSPDLIVFSGDFTQRAKVGEYEEAREFLRSFSPWTVVVTPGNHDVPLYRVWERLAAPHRNYRQFISEDLDSVTTADGAVVVALNSTAPLRAIVNGRLRDRQLLFAAEAFQGAPADALRVLVAHHHLAPAPDYEPDQVLPGFQRLLEAFAKMRVDMILGGHLHRAFVASSLDAHAGGEGGHPIVIVHAGTATSRRGRARERNKCSFNLIGITRDSMVITHYLLMAQDEDFVPVGTHAFPRENPGVLLRDPIRDLLVSREGPVPRKADSP